MSAPPSFAGADSGADKWSLSVEIVEARGLARMDLLSKSDPYVVLHLGPQQHRTRTIKNNLNPKWGDVKVLAVDGEDQGASSSSKKVAPGQLLELNMYDHNTFMKPDFMGRFVLPLEELAPGQKYDDWFQLGPRPSQKKRGKAKKVEGQIHLRLELTAPAAADGGDGSSAAAGGASAASGGSGRRRSKSGKGDSGVWQSGKAGGGGSGSGSSSGSFTARDRGALTSSSKALLAEQARREDDARRQQAQELDSMEKRIAAASAARAAAEAEAAAAAKKKDDDDGDDDDGKDTGGGAPAAAAAAAAAAPAPAEEEKVKSVVTTQAEEAVRKLSPGQSNVLGGNTSLKDLQWIEQDLTLLIRLNNVDESVAKSAADVIPGAGGNDDDDDYDPLAYMDAGAGAAAAAAGAMGGGSGAGAAGSAGMDSPATRAKGTHGVAFDKPGVYIALIYTSTYPETRPLLRIKHSDGSFDSDVLNGLLLTGSEYARDPVVTVQAAAAYVAQQFNSRFPMRGLGMSLAAKLHPIEDDGDDSGSDSDNSGLGSDEEAALWKESEDDDGAGGGQDLSAALKLDFLKLVDFFGPSIGSIDPSTMEMTINLETNFLDDDSAKVIGLDRSKPLVLQTKWADSYIMERRAPRFTLEQSPGVPFAVQFQLSQVATSVIESCMSATTTSMGDQGKAKDQIPLPQGLNVAGAQMQQVPFSTEISQAVMAGHNHLAAAMAYLSARSRHSIQPIADAAGLLAWAGDDQHRYDFATPTQAGEPHGQRWARILGEYATSDRTKAAESVRPGHAASTHGGALMEVVCHLLFRMRDVTSFCMICDARLEGSGIKPTICKQDLCVFRHEELGLGTGIAVELASDAEAVDLIVCMSYATAQNSSRRDLVFSPFPPDFWVGDTGRAKDEDDRKKDWPRLLRAFDAIPPMSQLTGQDESQIRAILDAGTGYTGRKDTVNPSAYRLLRWTLNSMRAHLVKLPRHNQITEMNTEHQYLMMSAPPERRKAFMALREKHGSFFAWHGSAVENWHAILRNGLRNLSNTKLMTCGAAYGAGIYLAPKSNTSSSYARRGQGWKNSKFSGQMQVIALCEVIDHPDLKGQPNPHYVIQTEDFIVTRFMLIYPSGKSIPSVDARQLGKYKRIYE